MKIQFKILSMLLAALPMVCNAGCPSGAEVRTKMVVFQPFNDWKLIDGIFVIPAFNSYQAEGNYNYQFSLPNLVLREIKMDYMPVQVPNNGYVVAGGIRCLYSVNSNAGPSMTLSRGRTVLAFGNHQAWYFDGHEKITCNPAQRNCDFLER